MEGSAGLDWQLLRPAREPRTVRGPRSPRSSGRGAAPRSPGGALPLPGGLSSPAAATLPAVAVAVAVAERGGPGGSGARGWQGRAHVPARLLRPELLARRGGRRPPRLGWEAREDAGGKTMGDSMHAWVGSAYLFVQATSEKVFLPTLYRNPQQRPGIFKALKLAFADSTGGFNGLDILKVHCSDPHLIIQLKFCKEENCRRFLQSYHRGDLQDALQRHLKVSLSLASLEPLKMELKAGAEKLDAMIPEVERCLECISRERPDHLRDEEIAELEESLMSLNCHESTCPPLSLNSSLPTLDSSPPSSSPSETSEPLLQEATFAFQGQQFANRRITPDDHQKFAKLVSKKWKQVGRSLYLQSKCRALRDPLIDNLAVEYEREGLYEQAYQLLRRYIDSEGKKATIERLIAALEDNGLISLAEELLGLHQSDSLS